MRIWRRILILVLLGIGVVAALRVALEAPMRRRLMKKYPPVYRAPAAIPPATGVTWLEVAHGFQKPTDIRFVPGGSGLAVVLEQFGKARLVDLAGAGRPMPESVAPGATVLDVQVRTDSELGLLGITFHPKYAQNGLFYVNSNPADGDIRTRISEWRLAHEEAGRRAAHDERIVLEAPQLYANHKAGQLDFGPDGYLYVGLGDGGWRGDPDHNGQNLKTLLGKVLRIDVDGRKSGQYSIPADNPFAGKPGSRGEIWAYGFRNPWRFSFDGFGRLVVGDVGQDRYEEIDLVKRGENFGWNVREGTHCFEPPADCASAGFVEPIFEYGRELGSCVTGGHVYTGTTAPELRDHYIFGDFLSGAVWAIKLPGPNLAEAGPREARLLGNWPFLVSGFARDESGELYLLDYASGKVYRLARK